MQRIFIVIIVLVSSFSSAAQEIEKEEVTSKKGTMYFYWGYNRSFYSCSDIHFKGPHYDFTLYDLTARDRPSRFSSEYFKPRTFTIPQYNVRMGYFFNDRMALSVGMDHLKYVIDLNQPTTISGVISPEASSTYAGSYLNEPIQLSHKMLLFEHTDGLNLVSLDFEYLFPIRNLKNEKFQFYWNSGIGGLWAITKTNVKVLGDGLDNRFHLSGYTLAGKTGPRFEFKNRLFLSAELKAGYATLPSVLIKNDAPEIANHNFSYLEYYVVLGYNFRLHSKKRNSN